MKQQLRFLIAGFSLIGLLVYTATPASAQQAGSTKFTVTLMALNISVSPTAIPLGEVPAGSTVNSTQPPSATPHIEVNLGSATVQLFAAGTNTKSSGPNNDVVWRLVKSTPVKDEFKVEVQSKEVGNPFKALAGPAKDPSNPDADKFNAVGQPEFLGVTFSTQLIPWNFTAPSTSQVTAAQEFNITFASASTSATIEQVNQVLSIAAPTATTTSGAISPVPAP